MVFIAPRAGARPGLKVLDQRKPGASLSYMDLVEAAFVAAFRKAGVSLRHIRVAHEHLRGHFKVEYPFAELDLQTEGRHILYGLGEDGAEAWVRKLVLAEASRKGQLVWTEPIRHQFLQFEYDRDLRLAVRWYPRGSQVPVMVDPQVQFGEPVLIASKIPTWVIKRRWSAGEPVSSIMADFEIDEDALRDALLFEGVSESNLAA